MRLQVLGKENQKGAINFNFAEQQIELTRSKPDGGCFQKIAVIIHETD